MIFRCRLCYKEFKTNPARVKTGRAKYCSKLCHNQSMIGQTPWNKGTRGVMKANSGSFKKGETTTINNVNWAGDNVGYSAVHSWITRHYGRPQRCDECETENSPRFEWANISKKYKRDRKDWVRLCKKCHVSYDNTINKGWTTRRVYL